LTDRLSAETTGLLRKNFDDKQIKEVLIILTGDSSASHQFNNLIDFALEAKFSFETYEKIKRHLSCSTGNAHSICTQILICMIQAFRKHIWNERCNKTAQWEKDHDISQKLKTTPSLRRPNRPHNSLSAIQPIDDPEILDDPFIPPPLKPPIEHKTIKFARIWTFIKTKIEDTIGRQIQWDWNYIGSKGNYMNLDCPDLERKKSPCTSDGLIN